jgi:hypothetical protein
MAILSVAPHQFDLHVDVAAPRADGGRISQRMQPPDRHPRGMPATAATQLPATGPTAGSVDLVGIPITVARSTKAAGAPMLSSVAPPPG